MWVIMVGIAFSATKYSKSTGEVSDLLAWAETSTECSVLLEHHDMSGLRQGIMRVFGHQHYTSHKSTTAVAHNGRLCFHLNTQHPTHTIPSPQEGAHGLARRWQKLIRLLGASGVERHGLVQVGWHGSISVTFPYLYQVSKISVYHWLALLLPQHIIPSPQEGPQICWLEPKHFNFNRLIRTSWAQWHGLKKAGYDESIDISLQWPHKVTNSCAQQRVALLPPRNTIPSL